MPLISLSRTANHSYLLAIGMTILCSCKFISPPVPSAAEQSRLTGQKATQDLWLDDEVRPLPGKLDQIPMFNSNSPEWIKQPGILLSTFPSSGKATPEAHLNFGFKNNFTLFSHHFSHTPTDLKTLYLGIIVHNPNTETVTLALNTAASYQLAEAPFDKKPSIAENPEGTVFSGPGVRTVDQILRQLKTNQQPQNQADFPKALIIPPGEYRLLLNHPIPVKGLEKPINGRSTFMQLHSNQTVNLAELAMYAPTTKSGDERKPTLEEWKKLLLTGGLAGPRDKRPTPPGQGGVLIYSRVSGVQAGSNWQVLLTDPGSKHLSIPASGKGISYGISTLRAGRLGTAQTQAAKLLARYADTAYEAHGNYCVYYDLSLPLHNPTSSPSQVTLTLTTPIKVDKLNPKGLQFTIPPRTHPYFRGTVRLRISEDDGAITTRYVHLWQRTGELTKPMSTLTIPPKTTKTVSVDFLYPPDSTPPQILRIATEPVK